MKGDMVVYREDYSEDIREVLGRDIPTGSNLYNNGVRVHDILERLAVPIGLPEVRVHGLSITLSGDSSTTKDLEHCLLNRNPEETRNIHEDETLLYLHINRGNELATIVDENGNLSQVGGAFLPGNPVTYTRRIGNLGPERLGYEEKDDPGARHYSGLMGSAEIENGLVMVLSKKGEISTFLHGYMIHNSAGRQPYDNLENPESASMMRPPEPAHEPSMTAQELYLEPPEPASASIE